MFKRIRPQDATIGIYIHAFEGRFSDRPFWQTGLVLRSPEDLKRLQASSIDAVIIDVQKGSLPLRIGGLASAANKSELRPAPRRQFDPELKRVTKTAEQSKRDVMRLADDIRAGRPISIARLAPTIDRISEVLESESHAFLKLMRLKQRDEYTYLHSVAVAALMMLFARKLGIDQAELPMFGLAGLLHDIGKIAMPGEILNKPASLTHEEFAFVKTHPQAGAKILSAGNLPGNIIEACLHHHERIDGTGYPSGRSGGDLSLMTRMTTICDVYDAMTSHRFYKDAWSPQHAVSEMQSEEGHFDRALLRTFMRSVEIFPIGSLVRVGANTLAFVIEDNPDQPHLPTVRSFYSINARTMIGLEDIKIGRTGLLDLEDPNDWGFADGSEIARKVIGTSTVRSEQRQNYDV